MINVKRTVYDGINKKINDLRFLGKNDTKGFKQLISLVILDDLYDTADKLDWPQSLQKKLKQARLDLIQCGQFKIANEIPAKAPYASTNIPLTNVHWQRIWDSPKTVTMDSTPIDPVIKDQPTSFTPDPSCTVDIIYYPNTKLHITADPSTGYPVVDLNTLTTCQLMNLFINTETGQVMYLYPQTCEWKSLSAGELTGQINWSDIIGSPTIYQGITHLLDFSDPEHPVLKVQLDENGTPISNIDIATENDLDDVL